MIHIFYIDSLHDSLDPQNLDPQRYSFVVSLPDGTDAFRVMNVVDGSAIEMPQKLRCRSMSVGDVMIEDGRVQFCASMGWEEITDPAFQAALEGKIALARFGEPA